MLPKEATCGHCFRASYSTAECRHQVVCLRCSRVGHLAARCKVVKQSPQGKRYHVRSKKMSSNLPEQVGLELQRIEPGSRSHHTLLSGRVLISLLLSPEVSTTREELAKVAILSIVDGHVNDSSVLEVAPALINVQLAGPITPLNECTF